ncbi:uncharacterized protein LAJ45_07174 [Morchella importuna]|uniref:uncharacterized protein n=1 Tax=Morchella importuna TaxID=1174673 RepID=UPI001E8DBA4A|nr:uncharacterized protein LAJ45_07174 [Morchella importuna]KAH8148831.1 hypothetical protein LAJ45_07174 [Morchella importuna]
MNGHVPTFIPEPRIRAAQIQSRKETPDQDDDNIYTERSLGQVQSMMSTPTTLLEKITEPRFLNRFSTNAHGIMSENVQQRYLFSKTPSYGPLSISTPTSYHPLPNNARQISDLNLFDREEPQDYNHRFKPFGRRSSDAREPMPKLGQGDARIGEGILFGTRKIDSNRPPPLTFPTTSPPRTYSQQVTTFGSNPREPIQHTPTLYNRSIPERCMRKTPSAQHLSRFSGDKDYQYAVAVNEEDNLPRTNPYSNWPEGIYSDNLGEHKKSSFHQLDATAPVFQPSMPAAARVRPAKWNIQCRWTFNHVNDCRYGSTCNWGHEGDEYIDEPGIKHSFANSSGQASEEASQPPKQNNSSYSVHSRSPFKALSKQQSDDGSQKYEDSPDFSWVGGATNVNSWIGNQGNGYVGYKRTQNLSNASNGSVEDIGSLENQLKEEEIISTRAVHNIKDDRFQHISQTQELQKMGPEIEKISEQIERNLSIGCMNVERVHTGKEDAPGEKAI